MPHLRFIAMSSDAARAYRAGEPDANGHPPERAIAKGKYDNPCRHCLGFIADDEEMLILAHRPFRTLQPYAESGPVFLCAQGCERWDGEGIPPILQPRADSEPRLVKGYSPDERIVYGLGRVVPTADLVEQTLAVLDDPRVAYAHIRSSTNNCFTCRAEAA